MYSSSPAAPRNSSCAGGCVPSSACSLQALHICINFSLLKNNGFIANMNFRVTDVCFNKVTHEEKIMIGTLKIQVKPEEIIEAVKGMEKRKREVFLEDLLAATSPEYLKSIREARADYKTKRIKTHEEVFGK